MEMLAIDSSDEGDELDSDFEREMLSGAHSDDGQNDSNSDSVSKLQGLQNAQNTQQNSNSVSNLQGQPGADGSSTLDDRIEQMEFAVLQDRIRTLVANNIPFGKSGLLTSSVAFKDLTAIEERQLQINAVNFSSFSNRFQERLEDPSFMGLATLTLITDDLYQEGFQIDANI